MRLAKDYIITRLLPFVKDDFGGLRACSHPLKGR